MDFKGIKLVECCIKISNPDNMVKRSRHCWEATIARNNHVWLGWPGENVKGSLPFFIVDYLCSQGSYL